MRNLKSIKSAEYDSCSLRVIKAVKSFLAQQLIDIFNKSFLNGTCPGKLKIARVTLIFKSEDKLDVTNYRPISLLSVFFKILENIMYSICSITFNLSGNQVGFRQKYSTFMALASIINCTTNELEQRQHCISIFLDLTKIILLNTMNLYGIRGLVCQLFG